MPYIGIQPPTHPPSYNVYNTGAPGGQSASHNWEALTGAYIS